MELNQNQNQKKKFICKFCNKRYPCGKSLGGHIRIHQNYAAASAAEDEQQQHPKLTKKDSSTVEAAGYILRENPKKTRKFESDPNNPGGLIQVCKECGKGFQSLKALCGHMACHSRNYSFDDEEDEHSAEEEEEELMKDDLVMDDQSDTETSAAPSRRRRSKRTMSRCKNIGGTGNSSFSSMASDLEQDQEEVALCLMMLSKDSGLKKCLSYVADSSDNNSVVLEAKSTCLTKMRIKMKKNDHHDNTGSSCFDDDESSFMEMKVARRKHHQQRQVVVSSDNDGYGSENSDSGYFNYGPKKVESEVVSYKKQGRGGEMSSGLGLGKSAKPSAYKRARESGEHPYESGENSFEAEKIVPKKAKNPPPAKTSKFSSNAAAAAAAAKKAKVHECPFCSKVFRSGQALGGHKRSHFVGGADDTTVVIKQQVAEIPMIDLNLPPAHEEQANGFVTTW